MTVNRNLSKAKEAKKDEFYTQLSDIETELLHYRTHFENKIVYCNCDDPVWSDFWKYFHLNFAKLKLKKLVSTHYNRGNQSYSMTYSGGDDDNIDSGVVALLRDDGDFRSPECIELLKEADIIVTNPPFSLFREYIALLIEYDKKFIIWGNNNAITYKEVFPLIKNNKIWLGYLCNKTCVFRVGNGYNYDSKLTDKFDDGYKYGKVPAISVFTNLDISKRHSVIEMTSEYSKNPDLYPKYVNYDAVEVHNISAIPMDYDGAMGVPITFLGVYNPNQFEIIGNSLELCTKMSAIASKGEYMQGGLRPYIESPNGAYKYKRLYDRIFIKRKDRLHDDSNVVC